MEREREDVGVLLVCCVCDVLLVAVVVAIFGGSVRFIKAKGSRMQGYSAASILSSKCNTRNSSEDLEGDLCFLLTSKELSSGKYPKCHQLLKCLVWILRSVVKHLNF